MPFCSGPVNDAPSGKLGIDDAPHETRREIGLEIFQDSGIISTVLAESSKIPFDHFHLIH
jgi:hypothetical protein